MVKYVDMQEYPFDALAASDPTMPLVLDTETAGHGGAGNFVIYYSWGDNNKDVGVGAGPTTTPEGFRFLKAIIDSPRPKVFHAIKRDLDFLASTDLEVVGARLQDIAQPFNPSRPYCTLLAHALLDEYHPTHAVDDLVRKEFGRRRDDYLELEALKKGVSKSKKNLNIPQELMHRYAKNDGGDQLDLWNKYAPQLRAQGLWPLYEVTMDAELAWYQMERDGIEFDVEAASDSLERITPVREFMEKEIHEAFGEEFKITSHQQLGAVLKKHLPLVKKTKTGWATDIETLRQFRYDYRVQMVIAYNKLSQCSSKIRKRIEEGSTRLHATFKQVLVTGRSSCSGVPLQQIAKRAGNVSVDDVGTKALAELVGEAYKSTRRMWIPALGSTLVTYDYDQGEYRAAAHYTGSARLIALMQDPTVDFHAVICQLVFGVVTKELRDIVKHINFGILYGMGIAGIAHTAEKLSGRSWSSFNCGTPEETMVRYEREVPELRAFQQAVIHKYKLVGYVQDVFGRRYRTLPEWFKEVNDTDDYAIVNYLCQGTVGNIKRYALARMHKEIFAPLRLAGGQSKIVTEIHDEIVFEIYPEDAEILPRIHTCMTDFPQFSVPITTAPNVGGDLLNVKEMKMEEAVEACASGVFIRKAA